VPLRASRIDTSSLESEEFRAQRDESNRKHLARREWWLWFSTTAVTVLSAVAFILTAVPSYFGNSEHFYEIRSDQARWGVLCLMLLFNGWLVYRQWRFRRLRANESGESAGRNVLSTQTSAIDPTTGLHTRAFIEQQLGKEIARAKRLSYPLSLATIHLEDFAGVPARYGQSAADEAVRELAVRLRKACRGSDFAVRLTNDDFLLVLPECNLNEVKTVLQRLGSLEFVCAGKKVSMGYVTGWVDYRPGESPTALLKRATELLHLYKNAASDSFSATLVQ